MRNLRRLRAFWTAVFAALAFIQAAHAWEHLKIHTHPEHLQHAQEHQRHDDPVKESNDCGAADTACENSHSPAILNHHASIIVEALCLQAQAAAGSLPEDPVRKIDHPPQLS